MKKILSVVFVPFCVLVLLGCASDDASRKPSQATTPTPTPGSGPVKNPSPSAKSWVGLPAFSISSLESKMLEISPKNVYSQSEKFQPDATAIGDACYGTVEATKLLRNEIVILKSQATNAANPILCVLRSLNQTFTEAQLIGDASEHTMLDKKTSKTVHYVYAPDSKVEGGVTYSSLALSDESKVPTLLMLWSTAPEKLILFRVADTKVVGTKMFNYIEAYQEGEDFHFLSVVIEGSKFSAPEQGGWMQLSYIAALNRYQGVQGYAFTNKDGLKAQVSSILKGNLQTGHAGVRQVTTFTKVSPPSTAEVYDYLVFGNFADGATEASYTNLVAAPTTENAMNILDKSRIINPDGSLKELSQIITLEGIKRVTLPSLNAAIFTL